PPPNTRWPAPRRLNPTSHIAAALASLDRITRIMPQLALDDVDRHAFARELDRVRVTQPVGRKPASHASRNGELAQFCSSGRARRAPPRGLAIDPAAPRPGRQHPPVPPPGLELLEPELIHPGFATLVALAVANNSEPRRSSTSVSFSASASEIRSPPRQSTAI